MPFRAVNRRGKPGYDPGLQRHHLLPLQLLARSSLHRMFAAIGGEHHRFDDFRTNGLLLPCAEPAALRLMLPLHRGPHRHYSGLVMERVGQIEATWARTRCRNAETAALHARMRLNLLQRALRRFLLDCRSRRLLLNRRDPLRTSSDFSDLDAVADALWGATG
ncbi:AHH domain-containing protein [Novosphingobium sp.]|uniref:AHH domain-containing protein n=1 Tax=Novosphingobium sp. TaxID=1874826 RepID=UPI002FDAA9C4